MLMYNGKVLSQNISKIFNYFNKNPSFFIHVFSYFILRVCQVDPDKILVV